MGATQPVPVPAPLPLQSCVFCCVDLSLRKPSNFVCSLPLHTHPPRVLKNGRADHARHRGGMRYLFILFLCPLFKKRRRSTLEASVQLELRDRRFPLPNNESPRILESPLLTPLERANRLLSSDPDPEPKKRRTELQTLFRAASSTPGIALHGKTMVFHID